MAMQTDVKATVPLTATGLFTTQTTANISFRTRIKAVYAVCGAAAGSVVIADGTGGATLLTLNTPTAANGGAVYLPLPGEGILAESGLHGTVTNVASIMLFYG